MNPKEEQTNSEVTKFDAESSIEKQKDADYINQNTGDNKLEEKSKRY